MTSGSSNVVWDAATLTPADRARLGRGATLWMVGLSGSGKSTLARALEAELVRSGVASFRLDGDNLRHGLNADLGFSPADRSENLRRVAHVAALMSQAGVVTLCALISPLAEHRRLAREVHAAAGVPFAEVFVDASLEACEARDPKGLYAKARAGELAQFTGIDAPFEPPSQPELHLSTDAQPPEQSLARLHGLVARLTSTS